MMAQTATAWTEQVRLLVPNSRMLTAPCRWWPLFPLLLRARGREVGCFLSSLAVSLFSTEAFIVFVFDNGYQYGWLSLLIYCSHVKLITFLL